MIGIDNMGRKRKDLIDKSTSIILRLDNKTLFSLCDRLNIDFDRNGECFDEDTKKAIIGEIIEIIKQYVK